MRALLVVMWLSSNVYADAAAVALARGDVAGLKAEVSFPLQVYNLWFDTEPCKKFTGAAYVAVPEAELDPLVACITELGARVSKDDPSNVVYGAGSQARILRLPLDGRPRVRAVLGLQPSYTEAGAVPIEPRTFHARAAKYNRLIAPAERKRIDATPGLLARASLRVCVDAAGKVDAAVLRVGPDAPGYGAQVEKLARTWKLAPFTVRGKPVRACSKMFFAYPPDRVKPEDLVDDDRLPPVP